MTPKIRANISSAILVLGTLALGCGDDDDDDGGHSVMDAGLDSGSDAGGDGGVVLPGNQTYTGTLVPILAVDTTAPIPQPHEITVLDNETGAPLNPPIVATSAAGTGAVTIPGLPGGRVALYVKGVGDATTGTYDTVITNVLTSAKNDLVRISSSGTVSAAEQTGGFTPKADHAATAGAIYWTPGGTRRGTIGCAKVFVDGRTGPATEYDQLYNGPSGLPVPLSTQSQTLRSGRFYIANTPVGTHTLRVSLDNGATLLPEVTTFVVPFPRSAAASAVKAVLIQVGIDIDVPTNPTPAGCPDP